MYPIKWKFKGYKFTLSKHQQSSLFIVITIKKSEYLQASLTTGLFREQHDKRVAKRKYLRFVDDIV